MYRTRRSNYTIRKQADYGSRRWSIHFRQTEVGDPYVVARTDTREQAREVIAQLIDSEEQRWQEFRETWLGASRRAV
jgi:hypothetical protein